jgi:hypothetical protein
MAGNILCVQVFPDWYFLEICGFATLPERPPKFAVCKASQQNLLFAKMTDLPFCMTNKASCIMHDL